MINICICDDSELDLIRLSDEIEKYEKEKSIQFNITSFNGSKPLIYELLESNVADIYILDVSMPDKNGFEVAQKIREQSETAVIIFLTSMEDQAIQGYRSRALRYIVKANLKRDLYEALDSAVAEIDKLDNKSVTVQRYNDYRKILHREIICVRRLSRQLVISVENQGEFTVNWGISEFFNRLDDERFLFIDRGCFVNIDFITQLSGFNVTLKNGEVLPVSRRCLQKVKQMILERWSM